MIRFNFHSPTDEPIPIDPTHLQTHESGQKSFPGGLRIATSRFATSFSSWRRTSARVSNVPVFPAQKHLACQPTIERTTVVIIEVTRRVSRRSAPRTSPTFLSLFLSLAGAARQWTMGRADSHSWTPRWGSAKDGIRGVRHAATKERGAEEAIYQAASRTIQKASSWL